MKSIANISSKKLFVFTIRVVRRQSVPAIHTDNTLLKKAVNSSTFHYVNRVATLRRYLQKSWAHRVPPLKITEIQTIESVTVHYK